MRMSLPRTLLFAGALVAVGLTVAPLLAQEQPEVKIEATEGLVQGDWAMQFS